MRPRAPNNWNSPHWIGGLLPGKKNSAMILPTCFPSPHTSQAGFSFEKLLKTGGSVAAPRGVAVGALVEGDAVGDRVTGRETDGTSLGFDDGKDDPDGAEVAGTGTVGTLLGSMDGMDDPDGDGVETDGTSLGAEDGKEEPDGAAVTGADVTGDAVTGFTVIGAEVTGEEVV